ncbi:two component transcriptional regulator, LytTR family [Mucilaginibacter lappiensis]|uniref:Two-component system LytT family response regulator n=1 Tax=Mucilaginibacter lappiensis TaxID=354630 RepID=A0ABR6PRD4_9SPHI|nr:LytTR family DNA-binding domain-containing protein [Mucilaginibacter lappiensis]MBB6111555.1 two-component system LytT family response regulator [Mucilaginibacter lappiensis]SIR81372.1 two component transcriptional regulator, LytTR family [Mucilaginibacter lappiensis]
MTSIRSIIIDDEPNNIENLQLIVATHSTDVVILTTASKAAEGIKAIQDHQPDLVFLDIQMPGQSGFDLLRALPEIKFEVIFITAYDKYGIQAIKFSALDYLLKPIDIAEFKLAIAKAKQKISHRQQNHSIENLLQYIKAGQKEIPKITLPTLTGIMYVKITDIVRCEASNNYTTFYLQNGEQVLVCKTLKDFADILKPHQFVRTHQSHLVNQQYVKSYLREDGGTLLLNDQTKVPISRQNRELVKETLSKSL